MYEGELDGPVRPCYVGGGDLGGPGIGPTSPKEAAAWQSPGCSTWEKTRRTLKNSLSHAKDLQRTGSQPTTAVHQSEHGLRQNPDPPANPRKLKLPLRKPRDEEFHRPLPPLRNLARPMQR